LPTPGGVPKPTSRPEHSAVESIATHARFGASDCNEEAAERHCGYLTENSAEEDPLIRKTVLVLVLAGLTPLHAGSTNMISSWFAPEAKGMRFSKLLVVVVTPMPV